MILPILISVSLAPGSYFFCALAADAAIAAAANTARATRLLARTGIVLSLWRLILTECRKPGACWQASPYSVRRKRHCCPAPSMIDGAVSAPMTGPQALLPNKRIGPRHPRLAAAGFRFARWLARLTMGRAGFHQLGSGFSNERLAHVPEKPPR